MKKLIVTIGVGLLVVITAAVVAREFLMFQAYSATEPELTQSAPLERTTAESSILLALSIELGFLEGLANTLIPVNFEDVEPNPTSALTEDRSVVRISRGAISVTDVDGRSSVTVPIIDGSYNIAGRFGVRNRNKGFLGWFERIVSERVSATVGDLRGTLRLTMLPVLRPDWTVNPQASLDLNVNRANLNVAHVGNISVRGEVEKAFNEDRADTLKDFADTLNKEVNLKGRVSEFWNEAFVVEKPTGDPLWVVVRPTGILSAPTKVESGSITFYLGMTAATDIVLQEETPENAVTPIPNVTIADAADFGVWQINLPVNLDYALLSDLLAREARQYPYDDNGTKVTVDDVTVFPSGRELGVRLDLVVRPNWRTKVEAEIYVFAEPILDTTNKKLAMSNLRFDVKSESLLVQSLDYLARPLLLSEVQAHALIDLEEIEAQAISEVNQRIGPVLDGLPDSVSADIDVNSIALERFAISDECAYIIVSASGSASAQLLQLGASTE